MFFSSMWSDGQKWHNKKLERKSRIKDWSKEEKKKQNIFVCYIIWEQKKKKKSGKKLNLII